MSSIARLILTITLLLATGASFAETLDATSSAMESAQESDQAYLKRTVAIARFTNETSSGTTFLVDQSGDRLGKQASDILAARLAATGRFLMFERVDADEVQAEKILTGIEAQGASVEYLIVGSVSEFGRSTESESGIFTRSKTQRAYAKVNVRLIEVSTGRIIYSDEGAGEAFSEARRTLGVGGSAGFDQSLTDKAISAAISELVSSVVENMTKAPWRSFLLAEEAGGYLIAGGASQGISVGDVFNVVRNGREVVNPQTGATIRLPGKPVARVAVEASFGEDSFSEVSLVSITEGQIDSELSQYTVSR